MGMTGISDIDELRSFVEEELDALKAIDEKVYTEEEIAAESAKSKAGRDDWMTPGWLVRLAREIMGGIETDPASSHEANKVIQAKSYWTKGTDGSTAIWHGRVFMNPPYTRGLIDKFIDRLESHWEGEWITSAFVITNNVTETKWAQTLAKMCSAVCMLDKRVHFVLPGGEIMNQTRQGQLIWYLARDFSTYKFIEVMSEHGIVFRPER